MAISVITRVLPGQAQGTAAVTGDDAFAPFNRVLRFAVVIALAEVALWAQVVTWTQVLATGAATSDFRDYYGAATAALTHGWSHLYDAQLQCAVSQSNFHSGCSLYFVNPPPLALLVAPLTALPAHTAYLLWACAVWLAVLVGSQLAAGPRRYDRAVCALLALALMPAGATVAFGQASGLVLLALAGGWWLAESGRPTAAGAVLAVTALKPQLAILLPPALLLARRYRELAAFAVAVAALALLSVLLLGVGGARAWLEAATAASRVASDTLWSLRTWIPVPTLATAAQGAVALVMMATAWRARDRAGLLIAVAVTGSMLGGIYLHGQDLLLYLLAIWYFVRIGGWSALIAAAAWIGLELGATPLLGVLAGAVLLVALAVSSVRGPAGRADVEEAVKPKPSLRMRPPQPKHSPA
jgi:Glycosyltransferase family 87